jgi:hypothetical protein
MARTLAGGQGIRARSSTPSGGLAASMWPVGRPRAHGRPRDDRPLAHAAAISSFGDGQGFLNPCRQRRSRSLAAHRPCRSFRTSKTQSCRMVAPRTLPTAPIRNIPRRPAGLQRVLEGPQAGARRLHQHRHVARLVLVLPHLHVAAGISAQGKTSDMQGSSRRSHISLLAAEACLRLAKWLNPARASGASTCSARRRSVEARGAGADHHHAAALAPRRPRPGRSPRPDARTPCRRCCPCR